jgi:RNA polymerase sigma factor (sigma-70 family)
MTELLRSLVGSAQTGDHEALNQLARCSDRFVRMFSGSLSRRIRNAYGSTMDFVMEGLADAFVNLKDFRYQSDEHFYAWVARAIRSRMIDAWRREGSQKRAGRPIALEEALLPSPGSPTASTILSEKELRAEVARYILQLQIEHPSEMEVVVLKVFDGLSWSEIGDYLDLSSDRVGRTMFARGVDLLRPHLEKALGETPLDRLLGG